nr:hypothetical protein [Tanacetum cinerariifolium]
KKDLSWTGLPEFMDDTVTDYSRPSPTVASTSAEGQNKDSSTFENVASSNPPKPFVKRRVQRETTRSQKYAYESPLHRYVGHRSYGPSMRPSYRPAGHRPHGSTMNPRKPTMNGARPYISFLNQAPSYETRPFLKSSAVRTQYRAPWVPTLNRNNPPVSRKFSTGRRNFPTVTRKFPTAGRKFTTGSTKNHTTDIGRKGKAAFAYCSKRRVQKETNKSQNHSYKSPSHRSAGHRPHGPSMNPRRPTMNGARPYKSVLQAPSYETRPFFKSSAVKN